MRYNHDQNGISVGWGITNAPITGLCSDVTVQSQRKREQKLYFTDVCSTAWHLCFLFDLRRAYFNFDYDTDKNREHYHCINKTFNIFPMFLLQSELQKSVNHVRKRFVKYVRYDMYSLLWLPNMFHAYKWTI